MGTLFHLKQALKSATRSTLGATHFVSQSIADASLTMEANLVGGTDEDRVKTMNNRRLVTANRQQYVRETKAKAFGRLKSLTTSTKVEVAAE